MQALPQAVEPADAAKVCFTAAYTVVFLQQALSLGLDDRRVLFANSLALGGQQRVHLDWPLGAALQFLVGADAAAEDSAREVDDGGAAVLPMPGGDPAPSTPWEIRAVAFWLLMVALLMVTLTWVRCVCSAARLQHVGNSACVGPGGALPVDAFGWMWTRVGRCKCSGAFGLKLLWQVMSSGVVQGDVSGALRCGGSAVAGAAADQRQPDELFAGRDAGPDRAGGGRAI